MLEGAYGITASDLSETAALCQARTVPLDPVNRVYWFNPMAGRWELYWVPALPAEAVLVAVNAAGAWEEQP